MFVRARMCLRGSSKALALQRQRLRESIHHDFEDREFQQNAGAGQEFPFGLPRRGGCSSRAVPCSSCRAAAGGFAQCRTEPAPGSCAASCSGSAPKPITEPGFAPPDHPPRAWGTGAHPSPTSVFAPCFPQGMRMMYVQGVSGWL